MRNSRCNLSIRNWEPSPPQACPAKIFASMLERAIRASNKEREVKALSKHARSRQIDQSFLLRVSFPLSALVEVPTFF